MPPIFLSEDLENNKESIGKALFELVGVFSDIDRGKEANY